MKNIDQNKVFSEEISILSLQYLCGVPLKSIKWSNQEFSENMIDSSVVINTEDFDLSEKSQQLYLKQTIYHPKSIKFPISINYKRSFLKQLIIKVESVGLSPCEQLCEEYINAINETSQGISHKTYYVRNNFLTIQENENQLSNGTTGLVPWSAAFCLADWLLKNEQLVENKNIIELGCGCGFTGLALCSNLKLNSFTFTDFNEEVLKYVNHNLKINDLVKENIFVESLNWEDKPAFGNRSYDVILGSDITFDENLIKQLVKVLNFFFTQKKTTVAYIAATIRNNKTFDTFLSQLKKYDLSAEVMSTSTNVPFTFKSSCFGSVKIL